MSEVFISYARATTEPQARQVAEALRGLGFGVWRDDEIPAHKAFTDEIEARLDAAKAVVVIWSDAAARSEWVRSEAERARLQKKLVQLTIDGSKLPMPFDQLQCADLTGWTGDLETHEWRKVAASVAELAGEAKVLAAQQPAPKAGGRPAVAVVPFANLTADPAQDYFVEGVIEEIVTSLSRFKTIGVVSAGSILVSKGRLMTPQEAALQLGVDYLLGGSVRRAGDRVRINVHLVETATGDEVWSDRLDEVIDDIFALQDRVAERVAGVIEPKVADATTHRSSQQPTSVLGSYDLYLRALSLFRRSRRAEMMECIELLDRAIALDPGYGLALSQKAVCHRQVIDHEWCQSPEAYRSEGLACAERALECAGDDAKVVAQVAASLPGLEGRIDRSLSLVERAIRLNPASAFVWLISGSVRLRKGDAGLAAEHLETALRLDPISDISGFTRMYLASARFSERRFGEALEMFNTTTLRLPVSYLVLAALCGHLGETRRAQEALRDFEAVSPGMREKFTRIWFADRQHRAVLDEGLALAAAAPSRT